MCLTTLTFAIKWLVLLRTYIVYNRILNLKCLFVHNKCVIYVICPSCYLHCVQAKGAKPVVKSYLNDDEIVKIEPNHFTPSVRQFVFSISILDIFYTVIPVEFIY